MPDFGHLRARSCPRRRLRLTVGALTAFGARRSLGLILGPEGSKRLGRRVPESGRRSRSRRPVDVLLARGAFSAFPLGARFGSYSGGRAPIIIGSVGRTLGGCRGRARALAERLRALSMRRLRPWALRSPFCVTLIRRQAEPWVAVAISIAPWSSFFPLGNSKLPVPGLYILREGECWSSRREGEVRRGIIERSPASGRASSEPYPTKVCTNF